MFKFLSVVAILFTTSAAFGFTPINQAQTQDLIRMKLWYEGVDSQLIDDTKISNDIKPLPEELLIPLDKLEAEV